MSLNTYNTGVFLVVQLKLVWNFNCKKCLLNRQKIRKRSSIYKWINVTFPTAVVFGTNDGKQITSEANYKMTNNSGRHLKVDVTDYVIDTVNSDAKALEALSELQIQSSQSKNVTLAKNGVSAVDTNKEFAVIDTKESINFGFKGKIDDKVQLGEKAYVESNVVFGFKALPQSGNEK